MACSRKTGEDAIQSNVIHQRCVALMILHYSVGLALNHSKRERLRRNKHTVPYEFALTDINSTYAVRYTETGIT